MQATVSYYNVFPDMFSVHARNKFIKNMYDLLSRTCSLDKDFLKEASAKGDLIVVQQVNSEISGVAIGQMHIKYSGSGEVTKTAIELKALCLTPKLQGQGYGSQLLQKFEDTCRSMNAREMFAYAVQGKLRWYNHRSYMFCKPDVVLMTDQKCLSLDVRERLNGFLDESRIVKFNDSEAGMKLIREMGRQGFISKHALNAPVNQRAEFGILMTKELIPEIGFAVQKSSIFSKNRKPPTDRNIDEQTREMAKIIQMELDANNTLGLMIKHHPVVERLKAMRDEPADSSDVDGGDKNTRGTDTAKKSSFGTPTRLWKLTRAEISTSPRKKMKSDK